MALAITGTMATAAHAAPSKADLQKQIDTMSNQLEDITESYNKLNIDIQKTTGDLKTLEASLAPAKKKMQDASGKVGTIATASYMEGRIGPMTALLSGGTQSDLIDRISYLDLIARANQRDIDDFTVATQTFQQRKTALKGTLAKQQAQLNAMSTRKAQIQTNLKKLNKLRVQAYGSATDKAAAGAAGPAPDIAGSAGEAVDYAYAAANKPAYYGYGDDGPDTYDCSGLTMAAWRAAGKSLPHNAAAQYHATARISRSQLKAGDLVFYRSLGHVGLYVGGGMIIDASRPGEPVKRRTIDIMTPYGYGRVT